MTTSPGDTDALATRLRRAYNPKDRWPPVYATDTQRWAVAARAATTTTATGREETAAALHTAYTADIDTQRAHGWPPRSADERARWLAVADAAMAWRQEHPEETR